MRLPTSCRSLRPLSHPPPHYMIETKTLSTMASSRIIRHTLSSQPIALRQSLPRRIPLTYLHIRSTSTKTRAKPKSRISRFLLSVFAYTGGFIVICGGFVVAFFIYDASTYREDLSFSDIPVSVSALNPRRGGPKNLPIADVFIDDDDCPEMKSQRDKPKLVILGSGWGSVALLKTLNPSDYHITVVSPVNYFLFTPMLPSATVGTLELRSLVEPVRRIVQRVRGHFLKAEAVDIDFSEKLLEVTQTGTDGAKNNFYLPYDKLVLGVGAMKVFFSCDVIADSSQVPQPIHMVLRVSRTAISSRL